MSGDKNNLKFGRIVYYEPNEIFGGNNIAVNQEDLNKYINLTVKVPSRYYKPYSNMEYDGILKGKPFTRKIHNSETGQYEDYHIFYLTDNYVNVSYNEFKNNGEVNSGELFGIDSIDISFDVQFFPQVTINFTDVKGFGLMSTMEYNYEEGKINNLTAKSFFTSLFNFPYPIFTLEVKGYYGRSVSFDLSLLEFNTAFDSQTGDFKTTVKFIGHMYGVYADIPMSYLMVSPYIDATQQNNKEIVGEVWRGISSQREIKNIPTYLSLLRNFSQFILHANTNAEGYSIYQEFFDEEHKINKLNDIYNKLTKIIELSNETVKHVDPSDLVFNDNDVRYLYENNTEKAPSINKIIIEYDDLCYLTNDGMYTVYRPSVETKQSGNVIAWYFPDIRAKQEDCSREKQLTESSRKLPKKVVNETLLDDIRKNLSITPNIENTYKILFKHLNCFSEHFFQHIEKIDQHRNMQLVGLSNYETDIPNGYDSVPPFPAVYRVNNNERQVIYPGEIPEFRDEPEVQLTEKIFKSVNYFGREALQNLEVLETTRKVINEVTISKGGSFFIDFTDTVDPFLKNYMIINPSNVKFDQNTFSEETEANNTTAITRTNTIRDIFLSRLATYGRLHYTKSRQETFFATEATLLHNSWKLMSQSNRKILENLRTLKNTTHKEAILSRYNALSGGTTNGKKYWGYINYQPGIENAIDDTNVLRFAQEGRVHYNGYSGSTLILYDYATSIDSALEKLDEIKVIEELKVVCDGYYSEPQKTNYVVYAYAESDIHSLNLAGVETEVTGVCLNRISTINKDGFYNWGYESHTPLGNPDTMAFLFDKYKTYGCMTDDAFGWSSDRKNHPDNYFSTVPSECNTVTNYVSDLNRIAIINQYTLNALREYDSSVIYELEREEDEWVSSNKPDGGGGTVKVTKKYTGKPLIPINALPSSVRTDEYINKGISWLEYDNSIIDFIKAKIPEYKNRCDRLNDNYYIIGKNFQYKRVGEENVLTDTDIWNIWVGFIDSVLELYGIDSNVDSNTYQKEIDKRDGDKKIKTDIYYTLKSLYDKWYCGLNRDYFDIDNENEGEYKKIHYLTTTFNDISKSMIVDLEMLINQIGNAVISVDQSSLSVLGFMSKTAQDNNSTFLTLPMKLNWGVNEEEIKNIFKPYSFFDGTDSSYSHDSHGVSYIVMYNGDVSHHLAINNSEYNSDGYDIANYYGNELRPSTDAAKLFAKNVSEGHDYTVPAFGVTYGMQNQNFFKNISVDTTNPSNTDYSIANTLTISQQGSLAGTNNSVASVKSLYPIYANRSYTCNVEMMGCMNITPLMYFQLNNVPLFRGAYMITNVHHRITPTDFTTTFSGVRVSKYKIPINTDAINVTSLLRTIGYGNSTSSELVNDNIPNDAECQIVINREVFYGTGTVGRLYINGVFQCFTMEPTVRPANNGTYSCDATGKTNAICPGTYIVKYGESWAGSAKKKPQRYKAYALLGHANNDQIFTPRLNSGGEIGGTPGRAGILIHMGNSNLGQFVHTVPSGNRWSEGCIIVGYPPTNTPDEDLTNSGNTVLESLTSFGSGSYSSHNTSEETIYKWSTARAFKRVADIVKSYGNNTKISIRQNLTDEEIGTISTLTGSNHIFKPLEPPMYSSTSNPQIPEQCYDIYNKMNSYNRWDELMQTRGMVKIVNGVNLKIDLKYASHDNFAGTRMYVGLNNAYIHSGHTSKITTMTNILSSACTGNTKLIIYDAARPAIVQKYMTCLKQNSPNKANFPDIAAPGRSFHNYGLALDISLMGPDGKPLFMGAGFDQASGSTGSKGYAATHMNYNNWINDFKPESISDITFSYTEEEEITYDNVIYSKYYVNDIRFTDNTDNKGVEDVDKFTYLFNTYFDEYNLEDIKTSLEKGGLVKNGDDFYKGVLRNRMLLIMLAIKADMTCIKSEWWHYQFGEKVNDNLIHDESLGSLN